MTQLSLDDLPEISMASPGGDPYALLRELREKAPLARAPMGLIALRRKHLDLLMSDATRQLETETKMMQGITSGPIFDFVAQAMLMANGDVHVRRRQPVSRAFAFKLMEAMRPKARALAEDLILENRNNGAIDFVEKIAAQIPARLIADILGVPRSDLPVFMQWISDTAQALGFVDLERREAIEASLDAFYAYVGGLLEERRARPTDDFLSEYVAATTAAGNLTEGEIRTQVVGLILAGSDTTRGSLCMILSQLLQHPEQWRAVCADPDGLNKQAVEEGLRFEPVIAGIPRVVTRDIEIEGFPVPAGKLVFASVPSMLRDPEVYADPETFNIHRTDHPRWHLVFGAGAHRCGGEALARGELEETIAVIARLAPDTRIIGAPPRLTPGGIRQVDRMEVELRGA